MLLGAEPRHPRLHAVEELTLRDPREVVAGDRCLERQLPGTLAQVFGEHDLTTAEQLNLLEVGDRALARDLEGREPLDLVAKQVDADRKVRRRSEDVDDPAPDRELSAGLDLVLAPVTSVDKASHQVLGIEVRTLVDHDRLCVFDSRAEPLQERAHRSNDYTRRVLRDRARQGHRVARRAVAETPHRAKPPAHGLDRG